MMYIRYSDHELTEFGVWKISDDMYTQSHVYYSDGESLNGYVEPMDMALQKEFVDPDSRIDILTRQEVEDLIFLELI